MGLQPDFVPDRGVAGRSGQIGEHDKVWGGSAYGSISAGSRGSMGQSVT